VTSRRYQVVALRKIGVSEHDVNELKQAIEHDATPSTASTLGRKTLNWIRTISAKIGTGALKLTGNVAQALISEWLRQYTGLPQK
jgi:hypothetical protein